MHTPALADIRAAAVRLAGHAVRTDLLVDENARDGRRLFLKNETQQVSGSFKYRGAFNRLVQLDKAARARGVVAWSSGNHAQAVAEAGRVLATPVTIVMPADAPQVKIDGTASRGAEIIFYDRARESREEIARALVAERGATLVPSYDDFDVICGQGTLGLELVEQTQALGQRLDAVLICCGGGGLTAGCATAIKALEPACAIRTVEPEAFDDHRRSFDAGTRQVNQPGATSFCDALLAPTPGDLTWPINARLVGAGLAVSDLEVAHAVRYAFERHGIVVEPGGGVALAAAMRCTLAAHWTNIGVVISGGNVDPAMHAQLLEMAQ